MDLCEFAYASMLNEIVPSHGRDDADIALFVTERKPHRMSVHLISQGRHGMRFRALRRTFE